MIHSNKTGSLIRVSVRAGAIVAGASQNDIKAVSEYGSKLGLLFQITDDLLDVTQSSQILGKTAAKDIAAEKATYPKLFGLEGTKKLAQQTHSEALNSLRNTNVSGSLLAEFADFVLSRQT